jgi:hypothetical protein
MIEKFLPRARPRLHRRRDVLDPRRTSGIMM